MRDKRQTIYGIGLTLCILLSLTDQKANIWVGQRLASCYTIQVAKTLNDNQTLFQSRDLLCNKHEVNEVLSKSKKDKILVTQQD